MHEKDSGREALDEQTVYKMLREHKQFIAGVLQDDHSILAWLDQASHESYFNALKVFIESLQDLNEGVEEEFDFDNFARVIKFGSDDRLSTYLNDEEPALMHQLQVGGILTSVANAAKIWEQEHSSELENVEVELSEMEDVDALDQIIEHREFLVRTIDGDPVLLQWVSNITDPFLKVAMEKLSKALIEVNEKTPGKFDLEKLRKVISNGDRQELISYLEKEPMLVDKLLPDVLGSAMDVADEWKKDKELVVNTLIAHYNFFKGAFSDPKFIDKVGKENREALERLYLKMSKIYNTDEKIQGLNNSLTEIHYWREYFSQQTDLLISIRDIIEPLSQAAVTWESKQKVEVTLPEVAEIAITTKPYLDQALQNLLKLKEIFPKHGEVSFDGFVKLFFFENRPHILPEDPDDRNYPNVRMHNIQVENLNEELKAVYEFLVNYSSKSENEFTREALGLIGPEIARGRSESQADFSRRVQAHPLIVEYFRELSTLIKDVSEAGSKSANDSTHSTQRINKDYLKKVSTEGSEESLSLQKKVEKLKSQGYYKRSLQMVDEMDMKSDDNRQYMVFFKQDSHGQAYLSTMNLRSLFGRLAVGMVLDKNEFERKLKLLKDLGYYGLPKELGDIQTYIKVNQDYSAFLNETDRHMNGLKLLDRLFKSDEFKRHFDAETQSKIRIALNTVPSVIDIKNIEHIEVLAKAYRDVNYLCKINNYPLIHEVREMIKYITPEGMRGLNIYLVDQRGKEIIGDKFQVNNLEALAELHQVYNVLLNSDTMRLTKIFKLLKNIYPTQTIESNELSIRKHYSKHVEISNNQISELRELQKLLKDENFRGQFSERILLKFEEVLDLLPKSRDGISFQVDVNNADHIRRLKTAYESMMDVFSTKKSLQGEVDLTPKDIQQEKSNPVQGYATPLKKSPEQQKHLQNQDSGKSESLGDVENEVSKVEKK